MAGVALIFQKITLADLSTGIMGAEEAIGDLNWIWSLAAVILAIVGIVYQIPHAATDAEILMESYRNPGMPPAAGA